MGRIAILEDSDGDGQIDKRTTFLDRVLLPRAISLTTGGVFFADQHKLYFVERDGDKPKGKHKVVDEKYAKGGNVEHKPNGMMYGLDNWMYNAKSSFRYKWTAGKLAKERTPFRGQWGISQDDWGRLFFNSNSTLLETDRFQPNILVGNDLIKLKQSIAKKVGNNRVHPGRVTPGLNRAYTAVKNGYNSNLLDPKTYKLINATGACGPVVYRGDNFPTQLQGTAFVTESAAQLVKAISTQRDGSKISGSHPFKNSEFLTSTDERFRPVNAYTAPDGSLYVLDMYHGIIQHKTYMTTYLRRQTLSRKLEGPGLGHGRIYRIRAVDRPLTQMPNLEKASVSELVKTLSSKNGIHRDLAQRILIEKADPQSAKLLRETLSSKTAPVTKAHALWCLEGLGQLKIDDLKSALAAKDPNLTSTTLYAALSLSEEERAKAVSLISSVSATSETSVYQARFLASTPTDEAQEALVQLLQKHGKDKFVRSAALAGMKKTAEKFEQINKGRYSEKSFDEHLKGCLKGPQKQVDPASLLKGEHLLSYQRGQKLYSGRAACIGCHGADGAGLPNLGPTLESNWVTGSQKDLTMILLHGLTGPIKINGKPFVPLAFMPGLAQNPTITDQDLADIMTFIRHGWKNRASMVTPQEVAKLREATKDRNGAMMTAKDFPDKQ